MFSLVFLKLLLTDETGRFYTHNRNYKQLKLWELWPPTSIWSWLTFFLLKTISKISKIPSSIFPDVGDDKQIFGHFLRLETKTISGFFGSFYNVWLLIIGFLLFTNNFEENIISTFKMINVIFFFSTSNKFDLNSDPKWQQTGELTSRAVLSESGINPKSRDFQRNRGTRFWRVGFFY